MKNILHTTLFWLIGTTAMIMISCDKETFSEDFSPEELPNVTVSVNHEGIIMIDGEADFQKSLSNIKIPLEIKLSGPAPKAFSVKVSPGSEVIQKMIGDGSLSEDAIILSGGEYEVPQLVEFPFGAEKASFNLNLSQTTLEKFYGRDLVISMTFQDASKGNSVENSKNSIVVLIKTTSLFSADEIHYVSFAGGGKVLSIPPDDNYTEDNSLMIIPIAFSLQGDPSESFSANITVNEDTVNELISGNVLENTVLLSAEKYSFPAVVKFNAMENEAILDLTIRKSDLAQLVEEDKKFAVGFTLSEPSLHLLDPEKKSIIVVIDPSYFAFRDVTSQYVMNPGPNFEKNDWDGVRWGILADWYVSDAVKNKEGEMGSWDGEVEAISMEKWGGDEPDIINGKISQTVTLPAGEYNFTADFYEHQIWDGLYITVAEGSELPDTDNVETNALAYAYVEGQNLVGPSYSVPFVLEAETQVTFGFVSTFTDVQQFFTVEKVKLQYKKAL